MAAREVERRRPQFSHRAFGRTTVFSGFRQPSGYAGTAPFRNAASSFFICTSEGWWMYIMWPAS